MSINKKAIALLLVSSFSLSLNVNAADDDFDLSVLTDLLNDESVTEATTNGLYSNEAGFETFQEESDTITVGNEEAGIDFNSAGEINVLDEGINVNANADYPEFDNIEMNSAGPEALTSDYVEPTNNLASSNTSTGQLPKTGPEHFLLLLLSMIIVGVVFYKRKFK